MGWRVREEGAGYVDIELIHVVVQQKLTRYCQAVILQFKKKNPLINLKKNTQQVCILSQFLRSEM